MLEGRTKWKKWFGVERSKRKGLGDHAPNNIAPPYHVPPPQLQSSPHGPSDPLNPSQPSPQMPSLPHQQQVHNNGLLNSLQADEVSVMLKAQAEIVADPSLTTDLSMLNITSAFSTPSRISTTHYSRVTAKNGLHPGWNTVNMDRTTTDTIGMTTINTGQKVNIYRRIHGHVDPSGLTFRHGDDKRLDTGNLPKPSGSQEPIQISSPERRTNKTIEDSDSSNRRAPMFENLNNLLIEGGTLKSIGRDNYETHDTHNFGTYHQHIYPTPDSPDLLYNLLDPVAAAHDSWEVTTKVSECFPGTRKELLGEIDRWIHRPDVVPVFILDGIAGIGKSTVAKTVAARAAESSMLGASFFFSRGRTKRGSSRFVVATLAFQLAQYHPDFCVRITHALRQNPDVLQKDVQTQLGTLISKPLGDLLEARKTPLLICIDALDECYSDEAESLLKALLTETGWLPYLRIFITCRPVRALRVLLQRYKGPHIFRLQEIEDTIVESDIRHYIDSSLAVEEVKASLPDLPPPIWQATPAQKEALVRMAGKLFIVASTAVGFILDARRISPSKQLKLLLEAPDGEPLITSMDRLYAEILSAAVPHPVEDWFVCYQHIVGTIIVLETTLPCEDLARLLGVQVHDVFATLSDLHAILSPTGHASQISFRVHHRSFSDFVTDPFRCSTDARFYIDVEAQHLYLARRCLLTMLAGLKHRDCHKSLEEWYEDLMQGRLAVRYPIGGDLEYACTRWDHHLMMVGYFRRNGARRRKFTEVDSLLDVFALDYVLSWMEILTIVDTLIVDATTTMNRINAILYTRVLVSDSNSILRLTESDYKDISAFLRKEMANDRRKRAHRQWEKRLKEQHTALPIGRRTDHDGK